MYNYLVPILKEHGIHIRGVLHIGANVCEEMSFYNESLGIDPINIFWIDAFRANVSAAKRRNIANVYHATITNMDDYVVDFHIMKNYERCTLFPIEDDTQESIYRVSQSTITVPTFLQRNGISPRSFNFWNIHIEGSELLALLGAVSCMEHMDALCVDISTNLTEIDGILTKQGLSRVFTFGKDALYLRISE